MVSFKQCLMLNKEIDKSLYKVEFSNSWIYKTVLDNKIKNNLDSCKNIILSRLWFIPILFI